MWRTSKQQKLFCLLGHSWKSWKHNINIVTKLLRPMCSQPVSYLHFQQTQSNISIHLELCFHPPDKCKSNILFLLVLFWSPSTPIYICKNICLFSSWLLHYVHQLRSNCACLLFGAGQVVFCGFLQLFLLLLEMWLIRAEFARRKTKSTNRLWETAVGC